MTSAAFSLENPVFQAFIGYGALVLLKTLMLALLTSFNRITKGIFANDEDVSAFGKEKSKIVLNNPDVERVRRAHLNDLENILPFVLLGLLYVGTGPSLSMALIHFRVFAAARILHSIVYVCKVPQPARVLCFTVGMVVNVSLAVQIIRQGSF